MEEWAKIHAAVNAVAQKGSLRTPPSLDQHTPSPPDPHLEWGPESWPEEMPCIRAPHPEGGESGPSKERGRARLAVEVEWVQLMQELWIEDASVISNVAQ